MKSTELFEPDVGADELVVPLGRVLDLFEPDTKTCYCYACRRHRIEPEKTEPDEVVKAIEEAIDQHDPLTLLLKSDLQPSGLT